MGLPPSAGAANVTVTSAFPATTVGCAGAPGATAHAGDEVTTPTTNTEVRAAASRATRARWREGRRGTRFYGPEGFVGLTGTAIVLVVGWVVGATGTATLSGWVVGGCVTGARATLAGVCVTRRGVSGRTTGTGTVVGAVDGAVDGTTLIGVFLLTTVSGLRTVVGGADCVDAGDDDPSGSAGGFTAVNLMMIGNSSTATAMSDAPTIAAREPRASSSMSTASAGRSSRRSADVDDGFLRSMVVIPLPPLRPTKPETPHALAFRTPPMSCAVTINRNSRHTGASRAI